MSTKKLTENLNSKGEIEDNEMENNMLQKMLEENSKIIEEAEHGDKFIHASKAPEERMDIETNNNDKNMSSYDEVDDNDSSDFELDDGVLTTMFHEKEKKDEEEIDKIEELNLTRNYQRTQYLMTFYNRVIKLSLLFLLKLLNF